MQTYFVYILECSDKKFYIGVTNDVTRRLQEHNEGIDSKSWTYKRRPVKLVYHEEFSDINYAIAFEKQLKGWRRDKKIALIEQRWNDLQKLAKRKSEYSRE